MSYFKVDARNAGLILVALIGGIVGGVVSDHLTENSDLMTQAAFRTELLAKDTQITTLNSKVLALEDSYTQLSQSVETLEALGGAGFGAPDYDSHWMPIDQGGSVEVSHNLGSTNLLVYLVGEYDDNYTHQYAYGGNEEHYVEYVMGEFYFESIEKVGTFGAWWRTDGLDRVIVFRHEHDDSWHEFRVLIWRLPE